jgi:hypothetical protein
MASATQDAPANGAKTQPLKQFSSHVSSSRIEVAIWPPKSDDGKTPSISIGKSY